MDKSFDPKKIEQHWYDHWEKNNYFTPSGEGTPYCILIPPPNVTGTLHMGHAFQHTLMDALVRYHRMRGDNTLWQPGTDHAGIATQMVVERQLQADGTSRHDLGREAFINKVWEWKAYAGGTITSQMRRLGDSTDWPTEAFTMSDDFKLAVNTVFESLFDEGLIYRGNRLVNWDPVLHTAISDLEVISEEEDGHLWHLRYPVENSDEFVSVATTRPETMLGDTAVAIHPGDERYKHLQGKYVVLPLTSRRIPIIVDDYVDPEFGSGCVKITPAHDHNDWEIGQRHKLEIINILDVNAHILDDLTKAPGKGKSLKEELELVWNAQECRDSIPKKYRGLDRFVARKKIVEDLEKQGFLVKVEPYRVSIPRGDRSGVIVEPLLTDQWYMKMEPLAKPAIEAVERSDIRFVPENWSKTYNQWMHNIQDWCVSRQLWWGHQIPAWYDKHGNTYVAANREAVIQKYNLSPQEELHQDEDVLDTWFSSALWPFATHGWPNDTEALKTWLPSNVLITGFDIIFFWVSRMIMMTLKFTDKVPFKEIFITGLIRDEHGQKMSKSKGNILDPIDLIDGIGLDELIEKRTTGLMQPQLKPKIEKNTRRTFPEGVKPHGTDALRFTLTALASPSRDINFDLGRLEGYRNFCNKIWNASRYVLMNTEGKDCSEGELSNPDKWILFRLAHTVDHIEKYLKTYRFDLVAKEIYEFTWNE
ncbi:MAG: valine--tRNA ligase, partial [Gammaproteobacteria bacterium]